jgi:Stage II sporulation protein E (SpoIIE)/GAF domain
VSGDVGVTTSRGGDRAGCRLPPRLRPPDATADPARMASRLLDALIPGFADAAGMYVQEQLLSDGARARPAARPGHGRIVVRRLATRTEITGQPASVAPFPSGEVVALAAGSPFARCLRDAAPVTFAQPDSGSLRRLSAEARAMLGHYTSFLAAPLITRGTVVGMLVLARAPGTAPFRDADTQAATDMAGRAGAALADSLALMRHRSVAEALRAPLPSVASPPRGRLEIAGRCLPATGCDAGGDWYDIIPLPGDRTGLVVGDVMGHGPLAATVMTRLSAAAYALADLDLPPSEVMRQLNRTALALPQDTLVTCAYAVIDPGGLSCDIAAAGHLPPVLAMPGGTTRVVGMPGGQSLGVAPADYGQARLRLRPGTILALYTDGLVETRTRPFDQGITALRSALARPLPDLEASCEALAAAPGDNREDDITIVLARIPAAPAAAAVRLAWCW